MFGLGKKKKQDEKEVSMEMSTMENDLKNISTQSTPENQKMSLFFHKNKESGKKEDANLGKEEMKPKTTSPFLSEKKITEKSFLQSEKTSFDLEKRIATGPNFPVTGTKEGDAFSSQPKNEIKIDYFGKKTSFPSNTNIENSFFSKNKKENDNPKIKRINGISTPTPIFSGVEKKEGKKEEKPFFVSKNENKKAETEEKNAFSPQKRNWLRPALAFFVFLLAIASGIYYFYFVLPEKNKGENVLVKEEELSPLEIVEKEEEYEDYESSKLIFLDEAGKIRIEEEGEIIVELKKQIESNKDAKNPLGKGFYVFSKDEKNLTGAELLEKMTIQFQGVNSQSVERGWLFLGEREEEKMRLGLLFEIKENYPISQIKESILSGEKKLPSAFDGLYVDDQIPLLEESGINFSNSLVDRNFRYFNFYPDKNAPSMDWALKTIKKDSKFHNFLIFSTSMNVTKEMAKFLSY